jgi:rhodanese-related sulfurtransferase
MEHTQEEIKANRDYFAAKLAAEKTKHSVSQWAAVGHDPEEFLLLDVRDRASFAQGHIKGALSVPEAELDALMARLPKDRVLVTYCHHHY